MLVCNATRQYARIDVPTRPLLPEQALPLSPRQGSPAAGARALPVSAKSMQVRQVYALFFGYPAPQAVYKPMEQASEPARHWVGWRRPASRCPGRGRGAAGRGGGEGGLGTGSRPPKAWSPPAPPQSFSSLLPRASKSNAGIRYGPIVYLLNGLGCLVGSAGPRMTVMTCGAVVPIMMANPFPSTVTPHTHGHSLKQEVCITANLKPSLS